jgi:hypothetical protein
LFCTKRVKEKLTMSTRGLAKVVELQQGDVSLAEGNWDYIYTTSLVKDPEWNVGDHVKLSDGREFVYSKSVAACISGQGCEFTYTGYVAITTFTTAAAVGARMVVVPAATHAALTKDYLRGGYVVIYDGTGNDVQFRGIIGNDASILNVAFNLYLDGPLTEAITTASKIEVFENPYAALRTGTSQTLAKAGTPAVKVGAASTYFWVQKKGCTWVAPQSTVGENGGIGCCWKHDGSIDSIDTALAVTTATNHTSQYAGHAVTGSAAGNGPLFMLK